MKKKLLTIMLSLVLVMSLTGCTKSSGQKSASSTSTAKSPVEINFYEHTDNEKVMKALIVAFEKKNPDIKVNLHIIANDDYDDKIKVMLSGGADVDGFWLRGGAVTKQLAATGAILPLDSYLKKNNVDTSKYGDLGSAFTTNGKTYGLCTTKSCWLLWYNKDLFDKAGEKYPVNLTWDQYSDLAKKLTKGGLTGSVCPNWTMNLGATADGEYLTDKNLTKTMKYAKLLQRWYDIDKSAPSIEDMSGSFDINALFAEGKTYMMINGDWEFLLFPDSKPNFKWCAAPLPVFDDAEPQSTVGSSSCMSIAANSKKADATFKFIKFCCYSDDGATVYAQNSCIPAYPSDAALKVYKQNVTVPGAEYVFSSKIGLEQGSEDYYEELNTAFKEELQDALVGNCTLNQAFTKYKQRRKEIIAK